VFWTRLLNMGMGGYLRALVLVLACSCFVSSLLVRCEMGFRSVQLQSVRRESLSPTPIAGTPHLCDKSVNTASV
jgi:hypothetical protein